MGRMEKEEMVTIPVYEYEELLDALDFLQCLEASGVDNWVGYDDAVEMYNLDDGEDW